MSNFVRLMLVVSAAVTVSAAVNLAIRPHLKPPPAPPDPTAAIRAELQKFEQNIGGRLERIERDTAKLRGMR